MQSFGAERLNVAIRSQPQIVLAFRTIEFFYTENYIPIMDISEITLLQNLPLFCENWHKLCISIFARSPWVFHGDLGKTCRKEPK